jgi:hypothetical protein
VQEAIAGGVRALVSNGMTKPMVGACYWLSTSSECRLGLVLLGPLLLDPLLLDPLLLDVLLLGACHWASTSDCFNFL